MQNKEEMIRRRGYRLFHGPHHLAPPRKQGDGGIDETMDPCTVWHELQTGSDIQIMAEFKILSFAFPPDI
jgi:hypothetical protein